MYYLWRLFGYSEEELTYISVAEIEKKLKELDKERKKKLEENIKTRSGKYQKIGTRYFEDAIELIKTDDMDGVKKRWQRYNRQKEPDNDMTYKDLIQIQKPLPPL